MKQLVKKASARHGHVFFSFFFFLGSDTVKQNLNRWKTLIRDKIKIIAVSLQIFLRDLLWHNLAGLDTIDLRVVYQGRRNKLRDISTLNTNGNFSNFFSTSSRSSGMLWFSHQSENSDFQATVIYEHSRPRRFTKWHMDLSVPVDQGKAWGCVLARDHPYWKLHSKVPDIVLAYAAYQPFQISQTAWGLARAKDLPDCRLDVASCFGKEFCHTDESGAKPVDLRAREQALFANMDASCNIRQRGGNKLSSVPKTLFQ